MRAEAQAHADQIKAALALLRRFLDWDRALRRLGELNDRVEDQSLWNDPKAAQEVMRERRRLDEAIGATRAIQQELDDLVELIEMAEAEGDDAMVEEGLASLAALAGTMSTSVDAFDPQAVFLSASAARELQRDKGDTLDIQVGEQTQRLRVAGVLPRAGLEDRAGVMDIAAAQWKFGRLGKLSRINVRLVSGAPAERVRADIAALLPPDARVTTPGEASNEALRLSRAYRSNLTALALVGHVFYHHRGRRNLTRPAALLMMLVATQVTLGAYVVLSGRQEVINTAHVVNGALVLVTSLVLTLHASRTGNIQPGRVS
jgi:hypothetical protein